MNHSFKMRLAFLLFIVGVAACRCWAAPATQPAADWARLPREQWPQLVLTNEATFEGHTPLHGASAFLVKMPDGEVLMGTAKHLIKTAGGVDPPVPLTELDHVLTRWMLFPRTKIESVAAKGLAERSNGEQNHDWLLLHLTDAPARLPATPLIPRIDPVAIGEKVYLVGVPYSDHASQRVYEGVVTARPSAHYFVYEFSPPVHISGFSGAPIVDANGLLVGHGVSETKELKLENGLEVQFGGEDASLAVQLWQHRNDRPATKPADALHLVFPEDWLVKQPKVPTVLQFAEYPTLAAFVDLTASSKSDFSDEMTLVKWATIVKASAAKNSKLDNRSETDLKGGAVAGRPTVEYEITGQNKGVTIRYRMIMFECNDCYCRLSCWTTPAHWDEAQAKFEAVAAALK